MTRMMSKRGSLPLGGITLMWLGLVLVLLASESRAEVSVVLRLVDENNADIPSSVIQVLGLNVSTGSSVELPEGIHRFLLLPGIFGVASHSRLCRYESAEVTAATTEVAFEWITYQGLVRLHDQHGVDISGSVLYFSHYKTPGTLLTGSTVTLPITDESVYPTLAGDKKNGY